MSAVATGLDHVGIAGPDLDALAAQWERLGFTLAPYARHAGPAGPDGAVVAYATANRCIMLEDGYVELIAVVDAAAPGNMIGRHLARGPGVHILALGIDDPDANLVRLRAGGLAVPGVALLERPVDAARPDGPRARFARLPLPEAPEGHVMLIRHLTPEAIWRPDLIGHRNAVVALESVTLVADDPAASAARLARLAGHPLRPDPAGGFRLDLPRGQVRILPPAAAPAPPPYGLPWIGALTLRTADGTAALRACLADAGVPFAATPEGVLVLPEHTGGPVLLFTG